MSKDGQKDRRLGVNIRSARIAQGMTQQTLAERADLSVPYISRVERGEKEPSLSTLLRVADALDIGLDELLGLKREQVNRSKERKIFEGCAVEQEAVLLEMLIELKKIVVREWVRGKHEN